MKKQDLTDLLIKEGWVTCQMPQGKTPWLLYHPTKHICYRVSTSHGPQKSFFVPTQHGKEWMLQNSGNRNQVDAFNPGVSRYIGVGAWGRLKVLPDQKLVVDADEFLAFHYGV